MCSNPRLMSFCGADALFQSFSWCEVELPIWKRASAPQNVKAESDLHGAPIKTYQFPVAPFCGGRISSGLCWRAIVSAPTAHAPLLINTRAHSSMVAPVVKTSSMSKMRAPVKSNLSHNFSSTAKARRTFWRRSLRFKPTCGGVRRVRRSKSSAGNSKIAPNSRASSAL